MPWLFINSKQKGEYKPLKAQMANLFHQDYSNGLKNYFHPLEKVAQLCYTKKKSPKSHQSLSLPQYQATKAHQSQASLETLLQPLYKVCLLSSLCCFFPSDEIPTLLYLSQ